MTNLEALKKFDTPTICNALELIDPNRRNFGYTTKSFNIINPNHSPVVGVAKTATMRSLQPSDKPNNILKEERVKYYRYIHEGVYPKICIMQDLDNEDSGRGPFFGEFNTRIHRSLGVESVVTNGSVRDVTNLPPDILILSCGLRPSHANVHIVNYGIQVNVNGMIVTSGNIVHADIHGAVTFPSTLISEVIRNAVIFIESEKEIIEGCKNNNLSIENIIDIYFKR